MSNFTAIHYEYADEHNYKAGNTVYVAGMFSPEQLQLLADKLSDGQFFIPPQVGLEALQHKLISFPSEADHVWHSLDSEDFEVLEELPASEVVLCSVADLVERFHLVNWDVAHEYERLGLDDVSEEGEAVDD